MRFGESYTGFSDRSNRVFRRAQEAAVELGHSLIGSEHILYGLMHDDGGTAAKILGDTGLQSRDVFDLIIKLAGRGESTDVLPQGFTPRAREIAEIARMEANKRGYSQADPEHLLLGILCDGDSSATKIIYIAGLDNDILLEELTNTLSSNVFRPITVTARGGSKKGESKMLDQYSRDLTDAAMEGKLDPVIGRESEIQRVIQILSRRTKNNPVLIGEPGVGKTAIAEGLALSIVAGDAPETLLDKRVVTLDLSGMLAGTKYRGDFEERIKTAINEVQNSGDIILFIDELHTIIGAGAAEGAIDAANIIKPLLTR